MKKFIFLINFILSVSICTFSQTEKDQKLSIRNNSQSSIPSQSRTQTNQEIIQKTTIKREESQSKYNTNYPIFRPSRNFNMWNRWGAPYQYRSFYEFYTYDRWGYKFPVRVYQRDNGIQDTISSKKNKFRFGVNFSTKNEMGGWFTLGKSVYFKGQFNKVVTTDISEYYTNPTVNFYNATTVWNDQQLSDITKGWSLYLGVGREFKNFGVNFSFGVGEEQNNYQFFDEFYILSNNGNYSFKNFVDDYVTFSFGVNHDYKFISINADFDPIRKTFFLGAGLNF